MSRTIGDIRKCANKGCRNITRTSNHHVSDHPTAILRMRGGICVECYQPSIPPCRKCGHALRLPTVPASLAPGTKTRRGEGLCKLCWKAEHPPVPEAEISPEQLRHTIAGLEAFLRARRQRIEAMA